MLDFVGSGGRIAPSRRAYELEAVQDAGREFAAVRSGFFTGLVFNLFLGEAAHGKEARALGKRIVVADGGVPAVEVGVIRVVHVAIGDLTLQGAVAERVVCAYRLSGR